MTDYTVTGVIERKTGRLLTGPVFLGLPITAVTRPPHPEYQPWEDVVEANSADEAARLALEAWDTVPAPAAIIGAILSPTACAVLAGLVAPADDVHHVGIVVGDEVWQEIRAAFPLELFRQWAAEHHVEDVGEDGDYYDPEAGE